MNLADAKLQAEEDGLDWRTIPFLEKLARIEGDEGQEYFWRQYGPASATVTVSLGRHWLHWGIGADIQREPGMGGPERVYIVIQFGPYALGVQGEWPGRR